MIATVTLKPGSLERLETLLKALLVFEYHLGEMGGEVLLALPAYEHSTQPCLTTLIE
jgi:hypothetical protein